ncbi:MAG: hypothetical protein ACYCPQ_06485 [Elusimicrobiota bacterium]
MATIGEKDLLQISSENKLILQLHQSVWESTRIWQQNIVQYVAILVSVGAVMGWGLQCPGQRLFLATLVSQGAFLWILFITIEGAYQYRVAQAISSTIERNHAPGIFPTNQILCSDKRILPQAYYKFPTQFGMPELFLINFWTFYAFFLSLPLVDAYFFNGHEFCHNLLPVTAVILLLGFSLICLQEFSGPCLICCDGSCGSKTEACLAVIVFAPFFFLMYAAFQPGTALSAVSAIGSLLLLCFYCARKKKFSKDFGNG